MSDEYITSGSSQYHKCAYCGNYHTFSDKYCEDEHKKDTVLNDLFDRINRRGLEIDTEAILRDKIAELEQTKAEWFEKGRNSVLRKNESGCCCKIDEDGETIITLCECHKSHYQELSEVWRNKVHMLEDDLAKAWAENKQLKNITETASELDQIWENEFIDKCLTRIIAFEDMYTNQKCCGNCKNIIQKFDGIVCSLKNRFIECNQVCLDWRSDKKSWLERNMDDIEKEGE